MKIPKNTFPTSFQVAGQSVGEVQISQPANTFSFQIGLTSAQLRP